ncbi:MAG: LLM class flavin-dependent oxidoreductase [Rhodospirillaceae bacterium]|nr:LLM class flavin-dependent oxidoreductase [Rhodospirillaceae bacterium]MBT4426993.1 LLM class flavin-dependent oxidoreductase [Rhodospirillaceae bacterium]MBT5037455.1 LLM class flavin-dependent oxidoreductase [Rhodospirillaceae bacterium]MBT5674674.1 LLM class flavin-dependent oxidoreductase [Rhodospirillaceae bacterium]MBT7293848.1 LLM class flavin-dependent oxidoreductase [Rhodospirillaceae bacterium]
MITLSILDLSPITEGGSASLALANTLDLARHAESWGFKRYWLAEHHNMTGIASAATAVAIGHVAGGTSTIRVGAGGVMLPNHAPLVIAEQFGTLEALYPGRIDLGLGRAPGTDQRTAQALRRTLQSDANEFPRDVMELQQYFKDAEPGQFVQAVPGAGLKVPLYILGSSLFGARLAAMTGLPYAFASHFAPAAMMQAIELYRAEFQPSEQLSEPYVMVGFNVFAGESDAEAIYLRSSSQQSFLNLRRGQAGPLPPPVEGFEETLTAPEKMVLDDILSCSVAGSGKTVLAGVQEFAARTQADELIVTSHIFDHANRLRSFEILADVGIAKS